MVRQRQKKENWGVNIEKSVGRERRRKRGNFVAALFGRNPLLK
jgi:hypothetical protein